MINNRENKGIKYSDDSEIFIEYSNNDINKNVKEYNPDELHIILIVFEYMTVDMLSNKKNY